MKKLLLLSTTLILFLQSKSQIEFCPAGAEWHYNFGKFSTLYQETIKYERDSIISSDTVKVLSHTRFYMSCAFAQPLLTFIKQKGDTVFFKNNYTQNSWQLLYNFSVQAGQGWQLNLLRSSGPVTLNFNIDSVNYVTINNASLKRLYFGTQFITERIGSNKFLFPFFESSSCDGEYIAGMLCYQDSSFGLKQFSSLPCDYSTALYNGIGEVGNELNFKIYPNPVVDFLVIETILEEDYQLLITNVFGKALKTAAFHKSSKIDLSNLSCGIYFLTIKNKSNVLCTRKIVKE